MKISFKRKLRPNSHEEGRGRAHMFYEDLRLRFLPVRFERNNKYKVYSHGDETKHDKPFELLGSFSTERRNGKKRIVENAYKQIFKELVKSGEAFFLIEKAGEGKNYICQNHLDSRVVKKFGFYWLRQTYGDGFRRDGFEYILLNKRNVWVIRLPKQICSPQKQRNIMKFLKSHDLGIPDHFIPNQRNQTSFDVLEYNRLNIIGVLKSTNPWGWDGRFSYGDDLTEYHRLLLKLKLKWALTLTREHIESELNKLFRRLGVHVRLRIYGLHHTDQMEAILYKMRNGDLTFDEGYTILGLTSESADL